MAHFWFILALGEAGIIVAVAGVLFGRTKIAKALVEKFLIN